MVFLRRLVPLGVVVGVSASVGGAPAAADPGKNPGVMEIMAGLQGLQSGLLTIFAQTAGHIDRLSEKAQEKTPSSQTNPSELDDMDVANNELDDMDVATDTLGPHWLKPSSGEAVREFANKWLSLLGWSTGVTGLAKDFIFSYFKREFFHERNGPMINGVKGMLAVCSRGLDAETLVRAIKVGLKNLKKMNR